jgi:hypothetical protein
MLRQFLFGGGVSAINIAIHALMTTILVRLAQTASAKKRAHPAMFLAAVMIPTVLLLMVTHVLEVAVWSWAYSIVDAAPGGARLMYFAFVNYATLGYGDIVPVERWQLLGPMTAMNGVLLFGLVDRGHVRSAAPHDAGAPRDAHAVAVAGVAD